MSQFVESELFLDLETVDRDNSTPVTSLAELWAKRYVQNLQVDSGNQFEIDSSNLTEVISGTARSQTAERLRKALRFTTAQAWSKTEGLLAQEVQRHQIEPSLIDPWQIAEDTCVLLEKMLSVYVENGSSRSITFTANGLGIPSQQAMTQLPTPGRLSLVIASEVGKLRQKYTEIDPRVLGFVSMQVHYSGQLLLDLLSPIEKMLVNTYLKVIDDNLYMPLQRSYEAAANHDYEAPELKAVQQLLPLSSEIARRICQRVHDRYADYRSYSGSLKSPAVKISSLRDVEMFQVYLCLCVLEGSISPLQEELFPLCVMLYPPLKVRWELVRQMLRLLGQEINDLLGETHSAQFRPYSRALWEMFSADILPD